MSLFDRRSSTMLERIAAVFGVGALELLEDPKDP